MTRVLLLAVLGGAVLASCILATEPVDLDPSSHAPHLVYAPTEFQKLRRAENKADTLVKGAMSEQKLDPEQQTKAVESAIQALDKVSAAREAHMQASKQEAQDHLAAHEKAKDAENAAADLALAKNVSELKSRMVKLTAPVNAPPPKKQLNETVQEDLISKEIELNLDVAHNESSKALQDANAKIRAMHHNERKYKHISDMAEARHRDNLNKFCNFVYGHKSGCPRSKASFGSISPEGWVKSERKWKKAGQPMEHKEFWAMQVQTVKQIKIKDGVERLKKHAKRQASMRALSEPAQELNMIQKYLQDDHPPMEIN